jgi:hypothetical protein
VLLMGREQPNSEQAQDDISNNRGIL